MNNQDITTHIPEILQILRGDRSQAWMNDRLGYNFNKFAEWEKGRSLIKWKDFVAVCELVHFEITDVIDYHLGYKQDILDQKAILTHLIGELSQHDFAKKMGISRDQTQRLFSYKTEMRTDLLFKAIQVSFCDEVQFISRFINHDQFLAEKCKRDRLNELFGLHPWAEAIPRFLEVKSLDNNLDSMVEFVAKGFGIDHILVRKVMAELITLDYLSLVDGTLAREVQFYDTISAPSKPIRKFWTDECLSYILNPDRPHTIGLLWGYRLLTCSQESHDKIRDAYFKFYNEMNDIIVNQNNQTEENTKAMLLNVQFLDILDMVDLRNPRQEKNHT